MNMLEGCDISHLKGGIHSSVSSTKQSVKILANQNRILDFVKSAHSTILSLLILFHYVFLTSDFLYN